MPLIDRRDFLKLSGAVLAALPLGDLARADPAPAPPRPNILVFLTDDHGQWAQHCYGNSELRTPNLDALAAGGVRMTNAFTPCPVCSPARGSFWTGRMPSQHGVHDWLDENMRGYDHPGLAGQKLLSELLQSSGYHTGLVGKWHCGIDRQPQPGFDRWFGYWVNQYPHQGTQNFSDQGKAPNPQREKRKLAEYYGAVSSIDREVGRIIEDLKSHGQLENTLVVYTGDHGLNCGHHGVWEKGNATVPQNFLEESIRIACTLAWPAGSIGVGTTCGAVVNHCDMWATLLDIAGATPDAKTAAAIHSPGKSFLPALRGHADSNRDTQFSEYGNARMIRTPQYKLILRYPYAGVIFPSELYDLQADPRETVNRYTDPSCAAAIKDLTARLDQFFGMYTLAGHDGLHLAEQPICNPASPWLRKT